MDAKKDEHENVLNCGADGKLGKKVWETEFIGFALWENFCETEMVGFAMDLKIRDSIISSQNS